MAKKTTVSKPVQSILGARGKQAQWNSSRSLGKAAERRRPVAADSCGVQRAEFSVSTDRPSYGRIPRTAYGVFRATCTGILPLTF